MSKPKYVDILNNFWEAAQSRLKPDEGYLYLYLVQQLNRNFWENPIKLCLESAWKDLGMNKRSFQSARDRLIELGLIEFKVGNGRGGKSEFTVKSEFKGCENAPIDSVKRVQKSTLLRKRKGCENAHDVSNKGCENAPINEIKERENAPLYDNKGCENAPIDAETPLVINKTIIKQDINKQDINKQDLSETKVSEPQNENLDYAKSAYYFSEVESEFTGDSNYGESATIKTEPELETIHVSKDVETQDVESNAKDDLKLKKEKNAAKKEKSAPAPKKKADATPPDPLNAAIIGAYVDFCNKVHIVPFVNGKNAGAVKTTLNPYLRECAKKYKTEAGWVFGKTEEESALGIFKRALEQYDNWEPFHQRQIQLFQLATNLPNIINFLTNLNGKSTGLPTGGNISAAKQNYYRETYRGIIHDISTVGMQTAIECHGQNSVSAALEFQRCNVSAG